MLLQARFAFPALLALLVGCATGQPRSCANLSCAPAPKGFEDRVEAYRPLVERAAAEFGVPDDLVMAVIYVESSFRPEAVSRVGARGLMQLMPGTAEELARRLGYSRYDSHDPEFCIRAGTYYLAQNLRRFDQDLELALAAYATGPGRVKQWLRDRGKPPPAGMRYAAKVERSRDRFILEAKPVSEGLWPIKSKSSPG